MLSKDHIGMGFSFSLIRINFKDEITTFNPYIRINSNHNYILEQYTYSCILAPIVLISIKNCLLTQANLTLYIKNPSKKLFREEKNNLLSLLSFSNPFVYSKFIYNLYPPPPPVLFFKYTPLTQALPMSW